MEGSAMLALARLGARIRLRELEEERAILKAAIAELENHAVKKWDAGFKLARDRAPARRRYKLARPHHRARPAAFKAAAIERCRTEYLIDVARDLGVRDFVLTRWCRAAGVEKRSVPAKLAAARMRAVKTAPGYKHTARYVAAGEYERALGFRIASAPFLRALVELGETTAPAIAAKLGVKATTIYGRTYDALRAGWIERVRVGHYAITPKGTEALAADAAFEPRDTSHRAAPGRPTSDRGGGASPRRADPESSTGSVESS